MCVNKLLTGFPNYQITISSKVSVQGGVLLGSHFATLCQEVDFYEATFLFIIDFQKEKANIFNHSFIEKSLELIWVIKG